MVTAFIEAHHDRFGVVPICRVLSQHGCPIAPNTYFAACARAVSARAARDDLASVIDCYSRRLDGWAVAGHMRTSLVQDALKAAAAEPGRRRAAPRSRVGRRIHVVVAAA